MSTEGWDWREVIEWKRNHEARSKILSIVTIHVEKTNAKPTTFIVVRTPKTTISLDPSSTKLVIAIALIVPSSGSDFGKPLFPVEFFSVGNV